MVKQINCPHYLEEAKKTSVYSYKLINRELNLCKKCEKKLRKQILEQDKIEREAKKDIDKMLKKIKRKKQ